MKVPMGLGGPGAAVTAREVKADDGTAIYVETWPGPLASGAGILAVHGITANRLYGGRRPGVRGADVRALARARGRRPARVPEHLSP